MRGQDDTVMLVGDGDLYFFKSRGSVQARLGAFEAWAAFDRAGRKLDRVGGLHLEAGPVALNVGGRLVPVAKDATAEAALRETLVRTLESSGAGPSPGDNTARLIDQAFAVCGWSDD